MEETNEKQENKIEFEPENEKETVEEITEIKEKAVEEENTDHNEEEEDDDDNEPVVPERLRNRLYDHIHIPLKTMDKIIYVVVAAIIILIIIGVIMQ